MKSSGVTADSNDHSTMMANPSHNFTRSKISADDCRDSPARSQKKTSTSQHKSTIPHVQDSGEEIFELEPPKNDKMEGILNRELLVFRAQMSEQAARYDDMADVMRELCRRHNDLTDEERNLLSCAYKNVVGSRRSARRILIDMSDTSNTELDHDTKLSSSNLDNEGIRANVARSYIGCLETELRAHCKEIINLISTRLLTSNSLSGEACVFYNKMRGDYTRYLCETCVDQERKERANESLQSYKVASDRAMIELPPTHPVRLGLMLNYSVFHYDIMNSKDRACRLAKQAFDDAIAELDTLSEESYRESTIIMQLLRDNLNLWQSVTDNSNPSFSQQTKVQSPTSNGASAIHDPNGTSQSSTDQKSLTNAKQSPVSAKLLNEENESR